MSCVNKTFAHSMLTTDRNPWPIKIPRPAAAVRRRSSPFSLIGMIDEVGWVGLVNARYTSQPEMALPPKCPQDSTTLQLIPRRGASHHPSVSNDHTSHVGPTGPTPAAIREHSLLNDGSLVGLPIIGSLGPEHQTPASCRVIVIVVLTWYHARLILCSEATQSLLDDR